jgi:deoxycytidine triphosphate deaminase
MILPGWLIFEFLFPSIASSHPKNLINVLFNLYSAYDVVIPARGKGIAKTDLAIAIPSGTYARVAPRSGLAVKNFIDVGAGVVDEDYRGNVGVVLFNHSDVDFEGKLYFLHSLFVHTNRRRCRRQLTFHYFSFNLQSRRVTVSLSSSSNAS